MSAARASTLSYCSVLYLIYLCQDIEITWETSLCSYNNYSLTSCSWTTHQYLPYIIDYTVSATEANNQFSDLKIRVMHVETGEYI